MSTTAPSPPLEELLTAALELVKGKGKGYLIPEPTRSQLRELLAVEEACPTAEQLVADCCAGCEEFGPMSQTETFHTGFRSGLCVGYLMGKLREREGNS